MQNDNNIRYLNGAEIISLSDALTESENETRLNLMSNFVRFSWVNGKWVKCEDDLDEHKLSILISRNNGNVTIDGKCLDKRDTSWFATRAEVQRHANRTNMIKQIMSIVESLPDRQVTNFYDALQAVLHEDNDALTVASGRLMSDGVLHRSYDTIPAF